MPSQPYPISGNVKDVNGTNINKAKVEIINLRNDNLANGLTDSDGIFIIELENFTEFNDNKVNGDRIIIRSYTSGAIFKFDQRHAVIEGDALENQDLVLKAENPRGPKDLDEKQTQIAEHHPTADAKRIILVDEEGHLVDVAALDQLRDYDGSNRPLHIGDAKAGAKQNEPRWRIKKRFYTGNLFTESRYADGGRFTQKWSQRTSSEYKPT